MHLKGPCIENKCAKFGVKIMKIKKVTLIFQTMCRVTKIRHCFFYIFFRKLFYVLMDVVFYWSRYFLEANIVYYLCKPIFHQFSAATNFPGAQSEKLTMCRVTCVAWRAILKILFFKTNQSCDLQWISDISWKF